VDGATDGAQRNASWPKSFTLSGSARADGEIATAAMTSPAQMTISVLLRCAPNGAITSWVQVPPGQWSVGPVAIRRLGWVTVRVEAL
jgi:hypothetical protein